MNSSKWWTMKYCKQMFRNCNSQRSHIHQQKVFISLFVPREAEQNHMCTYICKSKTFDLWLVYRKLWEHELFKSIINFVIWISMFFYLGKILWESIIHIATCSTCDNKNLQSTTSHPKKFVLTSCNFTSNPYVKPVMQ